MQTKIGNGMGLLTNILTLSQPVAPFLELDQIRAFRWHGDRQSPGFIHISYCQDLAYQETIIGCTQGSLW